MRGLLLTICVATGFFGFAVNAADAPPKVTMTDDDKAKGEQIYADFCQECHGPAVRGGVKDLRLMDEATRAQFADIVLKGTKKAQGMVPFEDILNANDMKPLLDFIMLRTYEDYVSGNAPAPMPAK